MKLQLPLIFSSHMILQHGREIPIFGRSCREDTIEITLSASSGEETTLETVCEGAKWQLMLPAQQPGSGYSLRVRSRKEDTHILFEDVAFGEVWLAGGQSNMEFLLKYDEKAPEVYALEDDPDLRFFRQPIANFPGALEISDFPDDGFWRTFSTKEHRAMFSAPSLYMGLQLRKALGIPVGFIGVNWGGTPASAWTDIETMKQYPSLQPIFDFHEEALKALDWPAYYEMSNIPVSDPPKAQQEIMDKLMMGTPFEELFGKGPMERPKLPVYTPYVPGPRSCIRPQGLYDAILQKVAPYEVRGAIWYQGEDDDFRGWQDFYDDSMTALIASWRRLWNKTPEEFPFLQVELAPFLGRGETGAKKYDLMREKQRTAAKRAGNAYDICILDAGDAYNIHVRKKKPVGERLALLARKYVYGETSLLADSPSLSSCVRDGAFLSLTFGNAGEGLMIKGDLQKDLKVACENELVAYTAAVENSTLQIQLPEDLKEKKVTVSLSYENCPESAVFNSADLPAFPFQVSL